MGTTELTPRQQDVYTFVQRYVENNGYPPTLQEIAHGLGIQPNAARTHLLLMEKKRAVRYVPGISRGIELLLRRPAGIPIYGTAPAGQPFLSQENIVDTFEVRKYLTASDDIFGVYVRGDSMKGAELATGDLLFVDPKREPRNGEIVVASVEGQPTIKRFYRENGSIILRPENKKYKPIVVSRADENFRILGVVVGMIRALDKRKIDALTEEHRSHSRVLRSKGPGQPAW
jgi:repressor LexA